MPSQAAVIGYCRVSTDQQGESGLGLEAQAATIRQEAARRGWGEVRLYVDVASGKSTKKRPQFADALAVLESGKARTLVVAKLDRLSRSLLDFARLVDVAARQGWSINALDVNVDTSTTNGRMLAGIIMTLAQWEREMIGDRTRAALSAVKGRGTKLGRPTVVAREAVAIIRAMRGSGASYRRIAATLNEGGIPTAQGGREWYASTVRAIEQRGAAA